MKITVTFYRSNGSTLETREYESVEAAFTACMGFNLWALAHPVGTTSGAYSWNPSKDHNLPDFERKLSICCNNPVDYSRGLERLGILKSYVGRW